jgi:hypothetical protein
MGGGMAGARMGGAGFRNAQASVGGGPVASNFAGRGSANVAQGGYRTGGHNGWRGRGYGPGYGFAAGLVAGSALGYGYGGYYDPGYYGDDYAYDDSYGVDAAPGVIVSGGVDPAYCAQRYRSYDPGSGTYLGYDGMRHPCGE